jgi:hypothetical protein
MNRTDLEKISDILGCEIDFVRGLPQVKDLNRFKDEIGDKFDSKMKGHEDLLIAVFYLFLSVAWKQNIFPSSLLRINKAQANNEISPQLKIFSVNVTDDSLADLRVLFEAINQAETNLVSLCINPNRFDPITYFPNILKILRAAILEDYSGPLFLQTDSIYFDAKSFNNNRDGLLDKLKRICQNAIKSGIYNLNLDASELIDPEKSIPSEKMLMNLKMVAMAINLWIRNYQPNGIIVSVGGKIGTGEEGIVNKEELKDFLKRLFKEGSRLRFNTAGEDISKITINIKAKENKFIDQITALNMIAKKEFGLGGIVLNLEEVKNISQITELKDYEICEIQAKLLNNLKNVSNYQQIISACKIQKTLKDTNKYQMRINDFPKMNEFNNAA